MNRMLLLVLVPVAIWISVFVLLVVFQRSFLYQNGPERVLPNERGLTAVTEQRVPSDDVEVVVWIHDPGPDAPVFLYFHGNAGSLADRDWRFRDMIARGWGLVGVGLRGGSGTGGSPSETALAADARAVYDALPELFGRPVDPQRIVLYGESLGSGIAVTLANERDVGAVILETPFTAIDDLAQQLYWFYPVKALGVIQDRFRSIDRIAGIDAPLLILHGTNDRVVPFAHGERLFDAAVHPKYARWYEGGRHFDLWNRGVPEEIAAFLAR